MPAPVRLLLLLRLLCNSSTIDITRLGYCSRLVAGNATGDAIPDIPSGKSSMTFPKKHEDMPIYGHFETNEREFCARDGIQTPVDSAFVRLNPRPNTANTNNIKFPHPLLQLHALAKAKDLWNLEGW
ncbi:hypothetical protein L218DRAFT_960485 [Marasmius fiardii PR-910]|nr:hypothetical protein L218DRAFT_960485 [Marasmius fiardii PR-910]